MERVQGIFLCHLSGVRQVLCKQLFLLCDICCLPANPQRRGQGFSGPDLLRWGLISGILGTLSALWLSAVFRMKVKLA